jgi:hypothetical protein
MINEIEIKSLKECLEQLTGYIAEYGSEKEYGSDTMTFANNVCDALSWVLEEISSDHFKTDAYLNILGLEEVAQQIESRTQKKLSEYS